MTWIVVSGSHCIPPCGCNGTLVCSGVTLIGTPEFDREGLDDGGGSEFGTDALNTPSSLSLS